LLRLIKYLRYYIHFWKLLLNSTGLYYENLDNNIAYIAIYQITTDFNYIPLWTHSIGITKQSNQNGREKLIFNCI
jgi:hypothetical protein